MEGWSGAECVVWVCRLVVRSAIAGAGGGLLLDECHLEDDFVAAVAVLRVHRALYVLRLRYAIYLATNP